MTNEFNFDVKHEDYKNGSTRLNRFRMLIAHYFLSQTLTLNVYVRQKFRKVLLQRWMPTEISMQAISLHTGYRRSRSKGKLGGQSIPSPDITKGKLISSVNWNE